MQRNTQLDNAKGILIILLFIVHCIWPMPNPDQSAKILYVFINFFLIPMFALIAGYFSHTDQDFSRLGKSVLHLIVPYTIFMAIQYGLLLALGEKPYSFSDGQLGLWFLPTLFVWRAILPHLIKLPNVLLITLLASLAAGAFTFHGVAINFTRVVTFFPFFLIGTILRHRGQTPTSLCPKPAAYALLILAAAAATSVWQWDVQMVLSGAFSYSEMDLPLRYGIIARAMHVAIGFASGLAALSLVPPSSGFLTQIGRHSLHVFLLHTPLLLIYRIYPELHASIGQAAWATIPLGFSLAWLLSQPTMIGLTKRLVSPLGAH